ncbi:response regulator [Hymenobacter chitinivorans]|uniref:Hpt domain-containing protein n=1 Tax=Hymenobacter chitinivorans DSM 11115 TaxID=1121954 RepID=A0A2M9BA70_9BACT|nr:response regulator [Hymenobacter chitinivorans]PJJ54839.1 Hpt domain-containing protein [Hymenobacter chitinivorans DSM 11115]
MSASSSLLLPFDPGLRVLVADDNELNQLVVCRALEEWNIVATTAENGRQAVELASTQPFDAVLMDIQMPEMDGYEATRRLRRHQHLKQLPIIGLTASFSPTDQARALAAGMNETLPKPFEPTLLHASLVRHTARIRPSVTVRPPAAAPDPTDIGTIRPEWHLLDELAAGNEAFIAQIITTFLQQTPSLYQQLATADRQDLARMAHKLKGQIVYFGVPAIQQCLEKLERPLSPADAEAAPHLVAMVGHQLAALYPHLELRLQNQLRR